MDEAHLQAGKNEEAIEAGDMHDEDNDYF